MKVLYFIVCLLLVACGGDNQPEVNQPFELKNIIVGDQQNQQTFENDKMIFCDSLLSQFLLKFNQLRISLFPMELTKSP